MASQDVPQVEYNLTLNPEIELPGTNEDAKCKDIFVEFLCGKGEKAPNHVILSMDFEKLYLDRYRGALLSMDFDRNQAEGSDSPLPGTLVIKLLKHVGRADNCVRAFNVGREGRESPPLRYIIDHLVRRSNLQKFNFLKIDGMYRGCRDYFAQALAVLASAGCVQTSLRELEPILVQMGKHTDEINDALGKKYFEDGRLPHDSPIEKGEFTGGEYPEGEVPKDKIIDGKVPLFTRLVVKAPPYAKAD